MFQNSYQGSSFFELFDAKNIKEKERPIYKVLNSNATTRIFDKALKSYIIEVEGNNRMTFPRQQKQDLYLLQQYVVFQLFIQSNVGFGLELLISDNTKTKRRIVFSHTTGKPQKKPFFVRLGCQRFRKGKWVNLCIDLWSFIAAFKGQSYRSLDQIYIHGSFRLRKIYTTKNPLLDMEGEDDSSCQKSSAFIPKHFSLPPGVPFSNQTLKYSDFWPDGGETIEGDSEFKNTQTDISSNMSNVLSNVRLKETRKDFSTPKIEPLKSSTKFNNGSGQRKFLANTNSTEMMMRNHKEQQILLEKRLVGRSVNKTANLPLKQTNLQMKQQTANKTALISTVKTQLARPNQKQTSLQKKTTLNSKSPKKRREKLQATKINPWRMSQQAQSKKQQEEQQVKQQIEIDERDVKSAHTTVFKKKNNLSMEKKVTNQPYTNQKIDNTYSDSEYFQLSQKFSTITDPKIFKPEFLHRMSENTHDAEYVSHKGEDEEIEQAIEGEIGSMQDSKTNRHDQAQFVDKRSSVHNQSFQQPQQTQTNDGFMQQHLRRMMGQLQRPYTPPIHSNEQKKVQHRPTNPNNSLLQVIYDPVLNCYYDFKTNTYYELKA